MRGVLAADQGTPKMIEIAKAIQEGAMAYLKRQFKTIAVILIPLAIVVFVTSTEVVKPLHRRPNASSGLTFVAVRVVPHPGVRRRLRPVGPHRLHRHEPRGARQRAHRGRGPVGLAARPRSRWRSAPAASPACSPSASACSAPPSIIMIFQNTARRSSSASGSVVRCSRCSCGSAAASSPRRPTSAPTSSARSRPASPRTTPATRPPSPTTWATTSATAPAWPPTSSRATRSRWSRRSSSASPRSSRSG